MNTINYNELLLNGVINGDFDKISEALENGADIHQKTTKGNNLLYVAATKGQEEVFNELIDVEVSGKKIDLDTQNNMGYTTLMELIREDGFTSFVKTLLENKANPNIVANDGISPLIFACSDKKLEEVELLLSNGANPNYCVPNTNTTPFLMAASQSSLTICDLLVKNGADVNAVDAFGKNALLTAIYKSEQFMKKREKIEHKELIDYLCNVGIDLNYVAPSGMTALWAASLNRDSALVNSLLDKGANPDVSHEIGLEGKMSALHLWMNTPEVELIKRLISSGAKLGVKDSNGNTPDAIGFANPSLVDLMLELNADVNSVYHLPRQSGVESQKAIPVFSLIIRGGNNKKDVVAEMINRGVNVTYKSTELEDQEPLMCAITSSAYDIVQQLVDTGKVDVNYHYKLNPNTPSISPLSLLVGGVLSKKITSQIDKKTQIEAILKGKEINDQNNVKSDLIDDDGINQLKDELLSINSLEDNIKNQRKVIFDKLVNAGSNFNLQDEEGRTSLFLASDTFNANLLINAGADIFIKDNEGNNPFVYAVQNCKTGLIEALSEKYIGKNEDLFYQLAFTNVESSYSQQLLESGIISYLKPAEEFFKDKETRLSIENINYQDEDGNTPILVACANDLPFLASLYYRLGGDINIANLNNETPIMHAIASNNPVLVDFLIEKGANLDFVTNEGKSVLDFATETENKEIIEKVKIGLGLLNIEGSLSGVKKIKP